MTEQRIPLDGDRAIAFRRAFDERDQHIQRERLHLRVDGEESVPLPGCPECGSPADQTMWAIVDTGGFHEDELELITDVDPCGHRFRTPLPLPVQVSVGEDGATRMEAGENLF